MKNKYVLIKLSDDVEECKVIGFATKDVAVKKLKQILVKMVGPSDEEEFNFCESIKEAATYEKLEEICQSFRWGENNVRMLFIEEIK